MIRVIIDMNLGPAWVGALRDAGIDAVHWSSVGSLKAPDVEIFEWAARHERVVLTCDLDFSDILAASGANQPSVVVLRARDVTASIMAPRVALALHQNADTIKRGALVILDATRSRVRVLPLRRR